MTDQTAPPTLAEMTPAARNECQWMQADVADYDTRYVIANPRDKHGEVVLIADDGEIDWFLPEYVTPLPDLPRMTWPSEQKIEDVPTVKIGDVIDSADDPRLAALPVWTVLHDRDGEEITRNEGAPGTWRGTGYIPIAGDGTEFGPWTVRRIGLEDEQ